MTARSGADFYHFDKKENKAAPLSKCHTTNERYFLDGRSY